MLRMSFVKIQKCFIDNSVPKGSDILHEVEIPLTIKDVINGQDSPLDYVIKRINEG